MKVFLDYKMRHNCARFLEFIEKVYDFLYIFVMNLTASSFKDVMYW